MPGYIVENLSNLPGSSNTEELEQIYIKHLSELFSKGDFSQQKQWLEENDFEVFSWVINSGFFRVLDYLLPKAKENDIFISRIINTTLEKYNTETLAKLLNDFIENPARNEATKQFINFISTIITTTQEMPEEQESSSESESDLDSEEEPFYIVPPSKNLPSKEKNKLILPEFNKVGRKRQSDGEESAAKLAAGELGKNNSAFKPYEKRQKALEVESPSIEAAMPLDEEPNLEYLIKKFEQIKNKTYPGLPKIFVGENEKEIIIEEIKKLDENSKKKKISDLEKQDDKLEKAIKAKVRLQYNKVQDIEENFKLFYVTENLQVKSSILRVIDEKMEEYLAITNDKQEIASKKTLNSEVIKYFSKTKYSPSTSSRNSKGSKVSDDSATILP